MKRITNNSLLNALRFFGVSVIRKDIKLGLAKALLPGNKIIEISYHKNILSYIIKDNHYQNILYVSPLYYDLSDMISSINNYLIGKAE